MFKKGLTLSVMLCETPSGQSSETFRTVSAWKHDQNSYIGARCIQYKQQARGQKDEGETINCLFVCLVKVQFVQVSPRPSQAVSSQTWWDWVDLSNSGEVWVLWSRLNDL